MNWPQRSLQAASALAAGVALAIGIGFAVQHASGYERYSDGCVYCHGDFFDGFSPRGSVFPAASKHEMHKNQGFIGGDCMLCHGGPNNEADWLSVSGGTDINPGVGCVGCHGRFYDGIGDSGVGLRAAHNGLCIGCHPDDPEPLPESVMPTYYGTEDTSILDPCNLGPDFTESNTLNDMTGLDNDGDGFYDGDDPDCQDEVCAADLTGDDVVDVFDLLDLLAAWGESNGPPDLNGDGAVDVFDLLELLAAWGPCP